MRLLDTILFSLCVASFIIGVHEIITVGFAQGYWLIMLSSGLFLWFSIRKRRTPPGEPEPPRATQSEKRKLSRPKKKKRSRQRN